MLLAVNFCASNQTNFRFSFFPHLQQPLPLPPASAPPPPLKKLKHNILAGKQAANIIKYKSPV